MKKLTDEEKKELLQELMGNESNSEVIVLNKDDVMNSDTPGFDSIIKDAIKDLIQGKADKSIKDPSETLKKAIQDIVRSTARGMKEFDDEDGTLSEEQYQKNRILLLGKLHRTIDTFKTELASTLGVMAMLGLNPDFAPMIASSFLTFQEELKMAELHVRENRMPTSEELQNELQGRLDKLHNDPIFVKDFNKEMTEIGQEYLIGHLDCPLACPIHNTIVYLQHREEQQQVEDEILQADTLIDTEQ